MFDSARIDRLIDGCSAITRAGAVSLDDGSVHYRSEGFQASDNELHTVANQFKDNNSVQKTGITLEGVHYSVQITESNLIFGKNGTSGFFAHKSSKLILIAMTEGDAEQVAAARDAITQLGQFLDENEKLI